MVTTNRSPRVAIIGGGAILERVVLAALRRLCWSPSGVVDPSRGRTEYFLGKSGTRISRAKRTNDWRAITGDFDVAILAGPFSSGCDVAAALLAAEKAVFLVRPMLPPNELRRLYEMAAKSGVTLWVGHPQCYLPVSQWTRALLQSEGLGRIRHVDVRDGAISAADTTSGLLLQPDPALGGRLWNVGTHTLDLLFWWFGDIKLLNYRDDSEGGDECERMLHCQLPTGADVRIEFSRARKLRNSARIEGEHGFVEVSLHKNQVIAGSANVLSFVHEGTRAKTMRPRFVAELFEAELRDFRNSVMILDRSKQNSDRCDQSRRLHRPMLCRPRTPHPSLDRACRESQNSRGGWPAAPQQGSGHRRDRVHWRQTC